jgi:hypothetical protein
MFLLASIKQYAADRREITDILWDEDGKPKADAWPWVVLLTHYKRASLSEQAMSACIITYERNTLHD